MPRLFQDFHQHDDAHIRVIPADLLVKDDGIIIFSQTGRVKTSPCHIIGKLGFEEGYIAGEAACGESIALAQFLQDAAERGGGKRGREVDDLVACERLVPEVFV